MCLWIYCWGVATHVWGITMCLSCSGCARTLPFKRSIKWSIRCKPRRSGCLRFCTLFATHITSLLLAKNDRMTSFRDLVAVMFSEWLHLEFSCAWTLLSAFCYAYFRYIYFFHNRQSTRNTTKFDNYLVVHEGPEHITYFRIYCSAWTVLYMKTSFLSVNR